MAGGVRQHLRHRRDRARCTVGARSPGATCCCRSPTSTATPARSTGRPRPGAEGSPAGRRPARPPSGSRRRPAATAAIPGQRDGAAPSGVWEQAHAQSRGPRTPDPVQSVQLTLDLGDAPADALHTGEVSGLPEMDAGERVRAELEILGLDASRHVMDVLRPVPRRARRHPVDGAARAAQQGRAPRRRGQGGHPDPADPVRAPGGLPDPRRRDRPGRRDVLRGRARPLRHHGVPLLAARRPRRAAAHRPARGVAAGDRLLGAVRPPRGVAARRDAGGARRDGGRRRARPRRRAPARETGEPAARRVLVHSTGFRLSPYADIKPAGEATEAAPRKLWHSSPGSSGDDRW